MKIGFLDMEQVRNWVYRAIQKIQADYQCSSDTHLIEVDFPAIQGFRQTIYLADYRLHVQVPPKSLVHCHVTEAAAL